MIAEKIQCFLFEREIKKFLSLIEKYNSCKKEYDEMICPKIEIASGTLKCCDMFKNKNNARQHDFIKNDARKTIEQIKNQIENKRFGLFYDIPNNCTILTKNFKISMEIKTNESALEEISQDIFVEIEKIRNLLGIHSDKYYCENTKFRTCTRKYIIENKEKIIYLFEKTTL